MTVAATSDDPTMPALVANAYANAFMKCQRDPTLDQLEKARPTVKTRNCQGLCRGERQDPAYDKLRLHA